MKRLILGLLIAACAGSVIALPQGGLVCYDPAIQIGCEGACTMEVQQQGCELDELTGDFTTSFCQTTYTNCVYDCCLEQSQSPDCDEPCETECTDAWMFCTIQNEVTAGCDSEFDACLAACGC